MDVSRLAKVFLDNIQCTYIIAGVVTVIAVIAGWAFTKKGVFKHVGKAKGLTTSQLNTASNNKKEEGKTKFPSVNPKNEKCDEHRAEAEFADMPELTGEKGGGDAPDIKDNIDPVEYSQHIPSHIKRTEQRVAIKKIEDTMTEEQKQRERDIQRQQMEAIFKLMQENKETFGVDSMDEVQSQMKLYM